MNASHRPVLLNEAMTALLGDSANAQGERPGGCFVDATFGRGGHARALLDRLGEDAELLVLDRDRDAVTVAEALAREDERVRVAHASFSSLSAIVRQMFGQRGVAGILMDIGVSSPQLDEPERGFSFRFDGPLDMRMDRGSGTPVSAWLNEASAEAIARVIGTLGEERFAGRIGRAIVAARAEKPLGSTRQLAAIVADAIPGKAARKMDIHPATRTFQALRMFVNRELDELQAALPQAVDSLASGGRLVVISFHSLEDRIVKRFLRDRHRPPRPSRFQPVAGDEPTPDFVQVDGPVRAGLEEVAGNPRARSAVLRCGIRR